MVKQKISFHSKYRCAHHQDLLSLNKFAQISTKNLQINFTFLLSLYYNLSSFLIFPLSIFAFSLNMAQVIHPPDGGGGAGDILLHNVRKKT
jgi:hypothetical protein